MCWLRWNEEGTLVENLGCGLRVTLFLRKIIYGGSAIRSPISLMRLADVRATKKAMFTERGSSEHIAKGSNGAVVRD